MQNIHTLPVTVVHTTSRMYDIEPRVCIGEEALLEKIRLGLPSIVYRKLGELFGDYLHGFYIETIVYDDLNLNKESFLYCQVSLDVQQSLIVEEEFNNWWFDYIAKHNMDLLEYPTISFKFMENC